MSINGINVTEAIKKVEDFIKKEKDISPAARAMFDLLLMIVALFVKRFTLNSRNSSKPPSQDPNRKKKQKAKGERKPGGQKGHNGTNLKKVVTIQQKK